MNLEKEEEEEVINFIDGEFITLVRNSFEDIRSCHRLTAKIGAVMDINGEHEAMIQYTSSIGGYLGGKIVDTQRLHLESDRLNSVTDARDLGIGRLIMEGWTIAK